MFRPQNYEKKFISWTLQGITMRFLANGLWQTEKVIEMQLYSQRSNKMRFLNDKLCHTEALFCRRSSLWLSRKGNRGGQGSKPQRAKQLGDTNLNLASLLLSPFLKAISICTKMQLISIWCCPTAKLLVSLYLTLLTTICNKTNWATMQ